VVVVVVSVQNLPYQIDERNEKMKPESTPRFAREARRAESVIREITRRTRKRYCTEEKVRIVHYQWKHFNAPL
jgi:hypothetical protein